MCRFPSCRLDCHTQSLVRVDARLPEPVCVVRGQASPSALPDTLMNR